jgi:hypothetical protein
MNATYDAVEDRWKAAQLGEVISSKGFYQAAFHSRLAEKLMAAGHRLRRTGKDFEMDVFTGLSPCTIVQGTSELRNTCDLS